MDGSTTFQRVKTHACAEERKGLLTIEAHITTRERLKTTAIMLMKLARSIWACILLSSPGWEDLGTKLLEKEADIVHHLQEGPRKEVRIRQLKGDPLRASLRL